MTLRTTARLAVLVLLTLIARTAGAAGVSLAWDPNPEANVEGYVVHYGEQSQVYPHTIVVGNVTTLQIDALVAGKTYYFAVQARSTDGLTSALSSEVQATVASTGAGPATFTVAPGSDGHLTTTTLTWTPVADAQAYYLYVGSAAGLKDLVNSGELTGTAYTLPALAAEPTVFARLYTQQAGVWRFTELAFKPLAQTAVVPAVITSAVDATGHLTSAQLQWSTATGAQAYYLYVGSTPGAKDLVNSGELQATSLTLPALPAETAVYARLYTKQGGVWRFTERTVQPMVGGPARLLTPTAGQAGVTSAQVFTWAAVPAAQAYYLYLGTTPGALDLINTGEITRTAVAAPALPAGRRLYATLWTKLNGGWVAVRTEYTAALRAELTYPTAAATDVSAAETFTWTRVSDAQGYRLALGTAPGAQDLVASGDLTTTSYAVTGLAPGQTLYAQVETLVQGVWTVAPSTFTTAQAARFTRPAAGDGADLGGGLAWTTILGAEASWVTLGTSAGARDLFDSGRLTGTTVETPALPAGQPVFASVHTQLGGAWQARATVLTLTGAVLTAPITSAAGPATLSGPATVFTWTTITNAEAYYLGVGSTPGAKDLVNTGELQATSYTVPALPAGRTVHVSLWTKTAGVWQVTASTVVTR